MTYANKVVSDSDGFEVNVAAAFAVVRVSVTGVAVTVTVAVIFSHSLRGISASSVDSTSV